MPFQIRDIDTVAATMISNMVSLNPSITDFTEGSVVRALIDSVAMEIVSAEVSAFQGIREAISTGTYQNFDFVRLPANYATGLVRFFATAPQAAVQTVPTGTTVQVPNGNVYSVMESTNLLAGATYVDVLVQAQALGSAGNAAANTVNQIGTPLSFIASVNNLIPFINGYDQETDSSRKLRFQNWILSWSRGTITAITFAAENTYLTDANGNIAERVVQAVAYEGFLQDFTLPLGEISVFIDNGAGSVSNALLTRVQNVLLGYTDSNGFKHPAYLAAGPKLYVKPVIPQPLNVTAIISITAGYDPTATAAAVSSAIAIYLQNLSVGDSAFIAQITGAAINVTGVTNITLQTPIADTMTNIGHTIVPGVITLNVQ